MEIYTDSRMGMPDCVSWKQYPATPQHFDYQGCTRQQRMLGYGMWHHCLTDSGYDSDLE